MMNRLRYVEEIIMSLIHVLPFGLIVCLPSHLEMRERFLLKLLFGIFKRKTKTCYESLNWVAFCPCTFNFTAFAQLKLNKVYLRKILSPFRHILLCLNQSWERNFGESCRDSLQLNLTRGLKQLLSEISAPQK